MAIVHIGSATVTHLRHRRFTLIPAVLLLASTALPAALQAQARGREPVRARATALEPISTAGGELNAVIRATRGDEPASRRASVQALTPGEKAEALHAVPGLQALTPSGLGSSLRLTAHRPFVANQGYINVVASEYVGGDMPGGRWVLEPRARPKTTEGGDPGPLGNSILEMLGDSYTPHLKAYFKPSVAGKPLLLDFAVALVGGTPVMFTILIKGGSSWVTQEQTLIGVGEQHVLAIVLPETAGWYSVVLLPERQPGTVPSNLHVEYFEITAVK